MSERQVHTTLSLLSGLRLGGDFTNTAALTTDQNDLTVTNIGRHSVLGVNASNYIRVTGLSFGTNQEGDTIILTNTGSSPFKLVHEGSGSAAANRFTLPNSNHLVMWLLSSVMLRYDSVSSRWMVIASFNNIQSYAHDRFDDFDCGSSETGEVGRKGWTFTNGTFAQQAPGAAANIGVYRRTSNAVANAVASADCSSNVGSMRMDAWLEAKWRLGLVATNADHTVRFGLTDSTTTNPPANGVYIERLAADTSWFGVSRAAGAQTRTAALLAQDTSFHTFGIERLSATEVRFTIDNGNPVSLTTNIPAAATTFREFLQLIPTTALARSLDVDAQRMLTKPASRAL